MSGACADVEAPKTKGRSRVSNGSALFLDGVDGRSALARRYRDIIKQLVSDLGGDPSEAQSLIVRRASTLAVWCEQAEAEMARARISTSESSRPPRMRCGACWRTSALSGGARDITPDLSRYIEGKASP